MRAILQYRKKPDLVEALLWDSTDHTSLAIRNWTEAYGTAAVDTDHIQHLWDETAEAYILPSAQVAFAPRDRRCILLFTLNKLHIVMPGDYVVSSTHRTFRPCKPGIFAMTYGLAEETVVLG